MEARGNEGPGGAGEEGPAPAPSPSSRAARLVLDVAGVLLLAAGLFTLVRTALRWPLRGFDEGVLLTDAMLLLRGKAIYRDFYTNYPPGIFWTIAGLWKLFGADPVVLRWLGIAFHSGLSAAAGRVAGRACGRRFSALAAGLVLAWTGVLGGVPYAWLAALLAALVLAERLGAAGTASRGPWLGAGLAFGAVGVYRHDLFVYLVLALAAAGLARAARRRPGPPPDGLFRSALLGLAAGASLLAVVFVPAAAAAGLGRVAADLYFDQVRWVLPSRLLPLPDVLRPVSSFGTRLPAFAVRPFEGAVVLTFAGPLLGAIALLVARRRTGRADAGLAIVWALSFAVLPQMLGRTDLWHALYTVAPALLLGSVLAEEAAALPGLRAASAGALAAALAIPVVAAPEALLRRLPASAAPAPSRRYGGLPESSAAHAEARRAVLRFLDERGGPGDPVFVGAKDHRRPVLSEMELYFLADRTGATRYMQFDPGIVGRREVQEEMVRELESARPRAAVLSGRTLPSEPGRTSPGAASLLDEYLARRYRVVSAAGPYLLLERR